jgi:hypothetical protein
MAAQARIGDLGPGRNEAGIGEIEGTGQHGSDYPPLTNRSQQAAQVRDARGISTLWSAQSTGRALLVHAGLFAGPPARLIENRSRRRDASDARVARERVHCTNRRIAPMFGRCPMRVAP